MTTSTPTTKILAIGTITPGADPAKVFANDQFAVEAMARESLAYCDDRHLEMFETASHWIQHEQSAQLNNLLSEFFA